MKGQTRERWRELCEQAANEQNPAKLLKLITEINRLLTEKQERLNFRWILGRSCRENHGGSREQQAAQGRTYEVSLRSV
jgi:hypothetical protein